MLGGEPFRAAHARVAALVREALEGGGVVISSELWAHDRACGARLIAHWNPMGIYPFDFRNVSM